MLQIFKKKKRKKNEFYKFSSEHISNLNFPIAHYFGLKFAVERFVYDYPNTKKSKT